MGLTENFLISILIDFVKGIIYSFPKALDSWKFKKFFGKVAISGDKVFAVVDPYTHPLPRNSNRFIKRFLNRKPDQPLIGEDNVLGVNVVRVITYASSLFSKYRKKIVPINVDIDENIESKWDGTFICFGSSDSNIKTYDIEQLPEQTFYTFDFGEDGYRRFNIGGKHFTNVHHKDYGILLRLINPRYSEHFLFICAGLGEWGTSGSAYYLFDRWKELYKKYKGKEFCKIIEVNVGSDESAHEVYSISK